MSARKPVAGSAKVAAPSRAAAKPRTDAKKPAPVSEWDELLRRSQELSANARALLRQVSEA
jgi:hypothetical protein